MQIICINFIIILQSALNAEKNPDRFLIGDQQRRCLQCWLNIWGIYN